MAGIYIHIPFCKQACSYCSFHFSTVLTRKSDMIHAILQETAQRKFYLQNQPISSIYFGGGTPSILDTKELLQLFDGLYQNFEVLEDAEITLEANPDDLSKSKLKELRQTPINRLSIGVQSFFEVDLRFMNRAHSAKEAKESILLAQDMGFHQLNMDLIFGAQTTSNQMWEENLLQFFELDIPHLSAYSLTVEENTLIANQIKKGKIKALDDEKSYWQYIRLQELIKAHGFEQYEVSNYCKNQQYAKHNTSYWQGKGYLGLGPSAHSFNKNSRQWNISNNALYIKNLKEGKEYFEVEMLSETDRYHELLIMSLRTKWGIKFADLHAFSKLIISHFYESLKRIPKEKIILKEDSLKVNPSYLFQSDEIIRKLML